MSALPPVSDTKSPSSLSQSYDSASFTRFQAEISSQISKMKSNFQRKSIQTKNKIFITQQDINTKFEHFNKKIDSNKSLYTEILNIISEFSQSDCSKIAKTGTNLELFFENNIQKKTASLFKPLSTDLQLYSKNLKQADAKIKENNRKIADKSAAVQKNIDNFNNQISIFTRESNERIENFQGRINRMYRNIDNQIANSGSLPTNFQSSYIIMLKNSLKELENKGISHKIKQMEKMKRMMVDMQKSQTDQILNGIRRQIELCGRYMESVNKNERSKTNSIESVKITINKAQEKYDKNDYKEQINETEEKINQKLGMVSNSPDSNSSFNAQEIADNLIELENTTKSSMDQLKNDIILFHTNNRDVQSMIFKEIDEIQDLMIGKINLLERIDAADKRSQWCANRINKWKKKMEKEKLYEVDPDKIVSILLDLQQITIDLEKKIPGTKEEGISPIDPTMLEKLKRPSNPPIINELKPLPQKIEIPKKYKLTYTEEDLEKDIYPDKVETKKKASKKDKAEDKNKDKTNNDFKKAPTKEETKGKKAKEYEEEEEIGENENKSKKQYKNKEDKKAKKTVSEEEEDEKDVKGKTSEKDKKDKKSRKTSEKNDDHEEEDSEEEESKGKKQNKDKGKKNKNTDEGDEEDEIDDNEEEEEEEEKPKKAHKSKNKKDN